MEWLLIVGVVGFVFWQIRKGFIAENKKTTFTVTSTVTDDSEDDRRRAAEIRKIRDEISTEVAKHTAAVKLLQGLARIDGQTSEAERRVVFMFLQRHGAALTEERHLPYFSHSSSGEFSRAVELDEIGSFIATLASQELRYRLDVYACAMAIVATGGTPKKREAEALVMAEKLLPA